MPNELTVDDVARLCCWSRETVVDWIEKGRLHSFTEDNGSVKVTRLNLIRFLQRMRLPVPEEVAPHWEVKVLIIDDEPALRRMLRRHLLGEFPGITIEESDEGYHAGWLTHDMLPDIVILDLLLPRMDGFRLCEMIRKHKGTEHVRIIAISGLKEAEARKKILALGADDFIPKPFSAEVLKKKILANLPPERIPA